MNEQNVFEKLNIKAEDLYKEATLKEFFGNHLFEVQEDDYFLFPTSHVGDTVWLVGDRSESGDDVYKVLLVKDANKQQVVAQPYSFYHCEPIDRTWFDDNRINDIEAKIKNGGKYLAQKINKAFADVLLESASENVQIQDGQLDKILASVYSEQVKNGFHPDKFLFPEHLEAKLVQQGFIIRDREIQSRHYVGKTVTGQQAFWSNDLPINTAILLDSAVGIALTKKLRVRIERLRAFVVGVCGYYGMNPVVKNTKGIIAIEGVDKVISNSSVPVPQTQGRNFIDIQIIEHLRNTTNKNFDLSRLVRYCEETNDNFRLGNYSSVIFLTRAILDHCPPIFGYKNFDNVAAQYGGSSFKSIAQRLNTSLKKIADHHIHKQIGKKEVLPVQEEIDFSNDINFLLARIVEILES